MNKQLLVAALAVIGLASLVQDSSAMLGQGGIQKSYDIVVQKKGMAGMALGDLSFKPNMNATKVGLDGQEISGSVESLYATCIQSDTQCILRESSSGNFYAEYAPSASKSGKTIVGTSTFGGKSLNIYVTH